MKKTTIRRVAVIVICAMMAMVMSSCALTDGVSAYYLYSKATRTIKKAGGVELDVLAKMNFEILGEEMSIDMPMNIKQKGDDSKTEMEVSGMKSTTTVIGDMTYVESGNAKVKYKTPKTDNGEAENSFDMSEMTELSKDLFEGITIIKFDDGTREITIDLPMDKAIDMMGGVTEAGGLEGFEIKNATAVFRFDKKKNITNMVVNCDMSFDIYGMTMTGKIDMDFAFVNLGKAPEITLNYSESEYEEIDMSDAA